MILTVESVEESVIEGGHEEAEREALYSLRKYLSSAVFYNVGAVTAKKVVSFFGIRTPHVIKYAYKELQQVNGVGPKRMRAIRTGWSYQKSLTEKCTKLIELKSVDGKIPDNVLVADKNGGASVQPSR